MVNSFPTNISINVLQNHLLMEVCILSPHIPYPTILGISLHNKWSFPFRKMRIWLHLLKKFLMEKLVFCAVFFKYFLSREATCFPNASFIFWITKSESSLLKLQFGSFISSANDVMLLVVRSCIFKNIYQLSLIY